VKSALITGITGQDGRYLAELLLGLGYSVSGMFRGQVNPRIDSLRREIPDVRLVPGDLMDSSSIDRVLDDTQPDEVYNLAAISFVQYSFTHPLLTAEVTGLGALRLLEAIRRSRAKTRFYQASTSEMFGNALESPQTEATMFRPRSPYGCAKAFAHHATVNYREAYSLFAVGGILFNHESPRRGLEFVTRKITYHATGIKLGRLKTLELGNLEARRDWGFAGDYVRAMHLMLQQDQPVDYVIGTGVTHSVLEFVAAAFGHLGMRWQDHVVTQRAHERPADVNLLCAGAYRAHSELGWEPRIGFEELVEMMIESDLRYWRTNP
jgi:GDPmannose 4,6-dehydratase